MGICLLGDIKEKHKGLNKTRLKFSFFTRKELFSTDLYPNAIEKPRGLNLINIVKERVFIAIENRHLFILSPFLMIFGIILYKIPRENPSNITMVLIGVIFIIFYIYAFLRQKDIRFFALFSSLFLGFILLPIHASFFGTKMLERDVYGEYEARVDRVLSVRQDGQRLIISKIIAKENSRNLDIKKARLFVRTRKNQTPTYLSAGDIILANIRFSKVPSPVVIGGYDAQFQSYFDGIGAYATSTKPPKILSHSSKKTLRANIDNLRNLIALRIENILTQPSGGIAKALIVGDQSGILQETRKNMSASGLAHVLAISGLHLSLVAGGVFIVVRFLLSIPYAFTQRLPIKKIAAIAGILTALFYLAISGASVSAIRATFMLILIFGAVLFGRRALTMRNVAFAAIFIIITDPASIFRPSFQLSFAAVVALVGVYEIISNKNIQYKSSLKKLLSFFGGLASTSLIAGIATALFAAYHFQQTAPLGVIGNLIALPIVAFVVLPFGFIGVVMMLFGYEEPFIRVMGFAIDRIIDIANMVANLSEGLNYSPLLTPLALFFGLLAFAWLAFFTTRFRLLGAVFIIPLIAIFAIDKPPDILISASTKAIAVRGQIIESENSEQGANAGANAGANVEANAVNKFDEKFKLALISGRLGSFTTNAWQETYQENIDKKMQDLQCDILGCFYQSPLGFSVAFVKSKQAFFEDCSIADLVITHLYAPNSCEEKTQVVDRSVLKTRGMHWLKWNKEKQNFIIRPAIKDINRAWRP